MVIDPLQAVKSSLSYNDVCGCRPLLALVRNVRLPRNFRPDHGEPPTWNTIRVTTGE
jgi:hypothetical protein